MSNIKIENIKYICSKYPNIALSINDWVDLMGDTDVWSQAEIITTKAILMTGIYGKLLGCNCYIDKNIAPGHFRVSKKEKLESPSRNSNDWSLEMSLDLSVDKIEKYINLSVFW